MILAMNDKTVISLTVAHIHVVRVVHIHYVILIGKWLMNVENVIQLCKPF